MAKRRVAVHSTHEAAEKLGGIGSVLQGLLPEPAYQARFPRSLLVGVYHFPDRGSVIDDEATRRSRGWTVRFDSAQGSDGKPLHDELDEVADRFGTRIVYGERAVAETLTVPVLLASPQGVFRDRVDAYRAAVAADRGIDLAAYDGYPAITEPRDYRLDRLLRPRSRRRDEPSRPVLGDDGRPLPGGARWIDGRAQLPEIPALDAFSGFASANRYLVELQFHTFAASALWSATRCVLKQWVPTKKGRRYRRRRVTLFAHDWLGVPLWWAMRAAGDRVGRTVYFGHEARIFRLLAEAALGDHAAILRPVCNPEGYDASLYPYLARATAARWDLEAMFPGSDRFRSIFHQVINREAAGFDSVVAVGPLVRDELRVALRPPDRRDIALCPNGIPAPRPTIDEVTAARSRLLDAIERNCGFRPDIVFSAVARCELSKAPWRNVGLFRRFASRRPDCSAVFLWLSAPKPRPTREQVRRWARSYRWPLDHRPGPDGDLRPDEESLWRVIEGLNAKLAGRCAMIYINQFGWSADLLGAFKPGEATFADLRAATDVEVGLSVYEPFGIAPLEPFTSGAVCVLSDACGCARHLAALGHAELVTIGRFQSHGRPPAEVDAKALREIERRAYGRVITDILRKLGYRRRSPADIADRDGYWCERREARLLAAQAIGDDLSWRAAIKQGLWPAVR